MTASEIVVRVTGEVDMGSAPALMAVLTSSLAALGPGDDLAVDLGGVGFIGLHGLTVLIRATQQARLCDVNFRISRYTAGLLRLLQITATGEVLTLG